MALSSCLQSAAQSLQMPCDVHSIRLRSTLGVLLFLGCAWIWLGGQASADLAPGAKKDAAAMSASRERTWAATAPAAEVIEKVRNDERWIWKIPRVLIEAETRMISNPEFLKKLAEQPPKGRIRRQADGPAERLIKDLVAWDTRRIVSVSEWTNAGTQRKLFDGTQYYNRVVNHNSSEEQAGLDTTVTKHFGGSTLSPFFTGRLTYVDTWWMRCDPPAVRPEKTIRIKDLGIKMRDGRRYRVVRTFEPYNLTYDHWFDVQTGRLAIYQSLNFNLSRLVQDSTQSLANLIADMDKAWFDCYLTQIIADPAVRRKAQAAIAQQQHSDPRWIQHCREIVGRKNRELGVESGPVMSEGRSASLWIDTLHEMGLLGEEDEAVRADVLKRIEHGETPWQYAAQEAKTDYGSPSLEYRLGDWRDVGGGHYYPFQQDCSIWSNSEPDYGLKTSDRIMHVTRLLLDKPLPEELFKMELKDGTQVFDQRHMPPLQYHYKAHFTAEEWNEILAASEKLGFIDSDVQLAQMAMMGKVAPELRVQRWANSQPLTLAALKGKYVVLHFFADGIDSRVDDTAKLVELEKQWSAKGVTVIGVHTARADQEELQSEFKKKGIHYPVAVDQPREGYYGFGETFGAYKVISMPQTVLVDPDGIVLVHVHGRLGKVAQVLKTIFE